MLVGHGWVISADDPKGIEPFAGLTEERFARLKTLVRRQGGDVQHGQPWRLPLEDRVLLVATYWRTNLALRQVAPFGVLKSAADRIVDRLARAPTAQGHCLHHRRHPSRAWSGWG